MTASSYFVDANGAFVLIFIYGSQRLDWLSLSDTTRSRPCSNSVPSNSRSLPVTIFPASKAERIGSPLVLVSEQGSSGQFRV